jgi:hypothetical protein
LFTPHGLPAGLAACCAEDCHAPNATIAKTIRAADAQNTRLSLREPLIGLILAHRIDDRGLNRQSSIINHQSNPQSPIESPIVNNRQSPIQSSIRNQQCNRQSALVSLQSFARSPRC